MSDFDICPGDIVATSYDTGPYIVTRVHGPYDWHYGWDENGQLAQLPSSATHWSLSLKGAPGSHYEGKTGYVINSVWRRNDGRYFRGGSDDEIYLAKPLNIWDVLLPGQMQLPLTEKE